MQEYDSLSGSSKTRIKEMVFQMVVLNFIFGGFTVNKEVFWSSMLCSFLTLIAYNLLSKVFLEVFIFLKNWFLRKKEGGD